MIPVIYLSITSALAEDCTTADLNASSSSPLRSIPVYDQDGTGTCYAHVAAELISFQELKKGATKDSIVNPIYAAYTDHSIAKNMNTLNEGTIGETIKTLRKYGTCSSSGVQSCLNKIKTMSGMSDAEIAYYIQTLYIKFNAEKSKTPNDRIGSINRAFATMTKDGTVGLKCSKINESFRNILYFSMFGAGDAFDTIFNECSPKRSLFRIPIPNVMIASAPMATGNQEISSQLNNNLLKGYPVGVSLCAAALKNNLYNGLDSKTRNVINEKTCGRHAVMVTAQSRIGGTCKVMVRNSWGAQWHPKGIACACIRKDGKYQQICSDFSAAKVVLGCWYERKHLVENTFSTTSL